MIPPQQPVQEMVRRLAFELRVHAAWMPTGQVFYC
jgi:hypothetical protein